MSFDRTTRVLDMGCREDFSGHITGVALNPYPVAAAKR